MADVKALARVAGQVRDTLNTDKLLIGGIDYGIAGGTLTLGTVNATALSIGSIGVTATVLGNLSVNGIFTIVDGGSMFGDGNITLGGGDGDTITLGGSWVSADDIVNIGTVNGIHNTTVNLRCSMGVLQDKRINFDRTADSEGAILLPDTKDAPVALAMGMIRVTAAGDFEWYNGAVWATVVSTAYTLDDAYDASAGLATISVDAGDVLWDLAGAYSVVVDTTHCTGIIDGFTIEENASDFFRVLHTAASTLDLSTELGLFDVNANGAITVDSLTAGISLDSVISSNFTITANSAGAEVLQLFCTNAGVGTGGVGISADDDVSITATNGTLTLHGKGGAAGVAIEATNGGGTIGIGEANLTNNINIGTSGVRTIQVGYGGSTSATFNAMDVGIIADNNDALAHALTIRSTNVGVGTAIINIDAKSAITIDTAAGFSIDGISASNVSTTTGTLDITTTSGSLTVDATAGNLYVGTGAGGGTIEFGDLLRRMSVNSDTYVLTSTALSGNMQILMTANVAALRDLQIDVDNVNALGSRITFSDSWQKDSGGAGGYTVAMPFGAAAAEWTTFKTNFGDGTSLLNAINQCASSAVTLDEAYNAGTATITVDAYDVTWNQTGAYSFVVNTAGCTGVADGFFVEDGTDYFRLTHAGANTLNLSSELGLFDVNANGAITLDSATDGISLDGSLTSNFTITANNVLTQTLSISATNAGGGGANISVTAANQLSLEGTAGSLLCAGGAGVSIQSTGGAISIGSDANAFGLNLGTGGARTIILGNVTGATSVTVNTGTGGFVVNTTGVGTVDINGTNAVTIDAATGLSLDGVGASNLTATSGHLTLSTLTTGDVILSSIGYLVFKDAYYAASTYDTDLVLSDASAEWDTFETNFGEVSLLNAINQCATSVVTLDEAYNAGVATITVDAYDVTWNLTGAFSHVVNLAGCTGVADGFFVEDGTDYLRLTHAGANTANLSAELGSLVIGTSLTFDINAVGAVTIDSTGGTLNIGSDANAFGINIGTGAAARQITIGNTTGATGVVVNTGSGDFVVNTNQFVVDQSTGFVGINTSTPYSEFIVNALMPFGVPPSYVNGASGQNGLFINSVQADTPYLTTGDIGVVTGATVYGGGGSQLRFLTQSNLVAPYIPVVRMLINKEGFVGIGTETPLQKVNIQSGALRFDYVAAPSGAGCTLSNGGAGGTTNGVHSVKFTAVNSLGETELGIKTPDYTVTGTEKIHIADAPISPDPTVTSRNVYMNKASGVIWYKIAGLLPDNTTTSFDINVADASLVTAGPAINSTSGKIYSAAKCVFNTDSVGNVVIGGSGSVATTSGRTVIAAGSNEYITLMSNSGANYYAFVNQYGIGTGSALAIAGQSIVSLGTAATSWGMLRHTTANTAGNSLSVIAGGATSGATDKAGGNLLLYPGVSTGAGKADTIIYAYPGIAGATTDNTPIAQLYITGTGVGIGTSTIPHGGIGCAKFAMDGADNSNSGPHVQFTTTADDYPLFQQLNMTHDGIYLQFDCYYGGASWLSSDVGSNYCLWKYSDLLSIRYDSGIAAGNAITWNDGIVLNTSGNVGVGGSPAYRLDVIGGDINIAEGQYYRYGTGILAYAQTALHNYYFGSAGNLTTTGTYNTAVGDSAGLSLSAAAGTDYNTFIGAKAGQNSSTGYENTFIGMQSGQGAGGVFAAANANTAVGVCSLYNISTASTGNIAIGRSAGYNSSTGTYNVFVGMEAGYGSGGVYAGSNYNVAVGYRAGYDIGAAALNNTLVGALAGENLTTGDNSVLVGYMAGGSLLTGERLSALGCEALFTTTGNGNSGLGYRAGYYNQTGTYNTFLGYHSGLGTGAYTGSDYNVGVGYSALANIGTNSLNNTAIGPYAGYNASTGDDNVFIGMEAGYGSGGVYASSNCNTVVGRSAGYDIQGASSYNTLIGGYAGENITTGDTNVCLGYKAGSAITTENSYLYIANSDAGLGSTLLTGNFATGSVGIGMAPGSITARLHLPACTDGNTAGTAPLKFVNGQLLHALEPGAVEMNYYTLWFTPCDTTIRQSIDGTIFAQTADVTVANTDSPTTLIGAGRGVTTFPAGYFALPGKTIRVRARGFLSADANSTIVFTIKLQTGGGTGIALATSALVVSTFSNREWKVEAEITCRTTGGGGTQTGQGYATVSSSDVAASINEMSNLAVDTLDTTAANIFDVTAEWNSASASKTITCTNLIVESLD